MRTVKCLSVMLLVSCLAVPSFAADEKKGKKKAAGAGADRGGLAVQLTKMLEPVNLTDEQSAKIKAMATKANEESEQIRKDAGIGPEIAKAQAAARKEASDAGKKGKDLQAAVAAAVKLTAEQEAAMKKSNEVLAKCRKDVLAVLTEEQKEKLPEQAKKALSGPEKAAPKKKKAA